MKKIMNTNFGCAVLLVLSTLLLFSCDETDTEDENKEAEISTTPEETINLNTEDRLVFSCVIDSCGKAGETAIDDATLDDFIGQWDSAGIKFVFTGLRVEGRSGLFDFDNGEGGVGKGSFLISNGFFTVNISETTVTENPRLTKGIHMLPLLETSPTVFVLGEVIGEQETQARLSNFKCIDGCSISEGLTPTTIDATHLKGQWQIDEEDFSATFNVGDNGDFDLTDSLNSQATGNVSVNSDILTLMVTSGASNQLPLNQALYFRIIDVDGSRIATQAIDKDDAVLNAVGLNMSFECALDGCGNGTDVALNETGASNFKGTWTLGFVPDQPITFTIQDNGFFTFEDVSGGTGSGSFSANHGIAVINVVASTTLFPSAGVSYYQLTSLSAQKFEVLGIKPNDENRIVLNCISASCGVDGLISPPTSTVENYVGTWETPAKSPIKLTFSFRADGTFDLVGENDQTATGLFAIADGILVLTISQTSFLAFNDVNPFPEGEHRYVLSSIDRFKFIIQP
jgi:hypothetical protein